MSVQASDKEWRSVMSAARTTQRRSSVVVAVRPEWDEDVSWQDRALCRGADANLFFTPSHLEKQEEREAREALAKAVCARCPVRRECLAFALATRESYGIWGGLNELERRHILERRAG
jgi:WhiB family redox-sensing transcriptional regulator